MVKFVKRTFIKFAKDLLKTLLMNDKEFVKDCDFISRLCRAVENRVGRKMTSPRDYEFLSDALAKTGRRISGSTLKRIWGYNRDISDKYKPYKYTILSLVIFLGFKTIEDYQKHMDSPESESSSYLGETVTIDEIMPGSIVELTWHPNRTCSLTCLEKGVFIVLHSENGSLIPGDIVKFRSLTQNAPLYFNEVTRPGVKDKFIYTAGQRTGIRYNIHGIINNEEDTIIS